MTPVTYLDSELDLSSMESARFTGAGGDYRGKPLLGPDLAERLLALESEPEAYGLALYEAVFPRDSELREGLRESVLAAEREKSRLRFRLHLSLDLPDWVHALYWELLADPDRHLALARSPDTAFSRYLDARRAQGAPAPGRPRLLCVVSAPADVARYGMAEIHRDEILRSLASSFGALADAVEVAFLEPPATLGRLRDRLMEKKGFQLLHFLGHGLSRGGVSALVLEDEEGRVQPVEEKLLAEVFLGVRELRLVTLIACHGGAPSSHDPFSGLAGRLVQRGVPSVIAMRRAVRVDTSHLFTQHFYRHIAQTGRADAAVNEARQQLYLAEPRGIDWSSPVLYSRLNDGRLWLPRTEAPEQSPLPRRSFRRLKPLETIGLGAIGPALGAAVYGLGYVTLRAREDLLGSPRLTYPKQEWLVTGLDALGSLLWRGLSVLASDHSVLQRSAWVLLALLLGLTLAARSKRRPALLLGTLAGSTLLLVIGSGFYRIALRATSSPDADPSRGFACGKELSANLADRAAFETCSWLVNDTPRNDGRRSDLGGVLGWLLAVCLLAVVAGSRASVASQRLSRLRWTLVGAHALIGLLLSYDLPRAHAFGSWGLRYPRVLMDEECDKRLATATLEKTCWAFDVSAGAENKLVFFQGSGCQGFDGTFHSFRSECLLTLSTSPPGVIAHGPDT